MLTKLSIPITILLKPLVSWVPSIWNLIRRPRLTVAMKYRHFEFKLEDGKTHIYDIPFIAVTNNGKNNLKIKANPIKVNGEAYTYFVQGDNIFAKHYGDGKDVVSADADPTLVYKFYKENWLNIIQGVTCLTLEPNEEMLFPLKLIGSGLTLLNREVKDSKLFFLKNKLIFSVNSNGKNYEYGISRADCYKVYINYLASHTSRYYKHSYL